MPVIILTVHITLKVLHIYIYLISIGAKKITQILVEEIERRVEQQPEKREI
jgi:hypothetical protein